MSTEITVKRGRKVNPESKNAIFKARKEAGLTKRTGRPVDHNSKAYMDRLSKQILRDSGLVIKRGRKPKLVIEIPNPVEVEVVNLVESEVKA